MSDFTDLIQRLKERDPHAMAELYQEFGRLVYSVILHIVRNKEAAEDLTQEAFLRVWNSIHSFNGTRGSLGSWITTVARNRALDYLRSADLRMERTTCDVARADDWPGNRGSGEREVLYALDARRLGRALTALGAKHRLVLKLAYSEGMSHTEIATRTRLPLGTVKTSVRTALKILRRQLNIEPVSA